MFQVAPSIGNTALAQYHNPRKAPGLGEDFRHRQQRTAARAEMMQSVLGVTREPASFIKKAADHKPLTLNKSRR